MSNDLNTRIALGQALNLAAAEENTIFAAAVRILVSKGVDIKHLPELIGQLRTVKQDNDETLELAVKYYGNSLTLQGDDK